MYFKYRTKNLENVVSMALAVGCRQCDLMALIVFSLGLITTMKNGPIVFKTYQSQ